MAEYILAHDIGTSGDKASLFRTDGVLVDSVTVPYETRYPQPGWAEQDPRDWWRAVCESTTRLMEDRDPCEVKAIGVSGMMMGCLPLDRSGEPLFPCIIWSDSRAEDESRLMAEYLGEDFISQHTGQPLSPNYTLPKIMWFKKHYPELMAKTDVFVQAKDYINYCLTGECRTDPTDAGCTLAYDLMKGEWSETILSAVDIPASVFPRVEACETIVGTVTKEAAAACGLVPGIPVTAGAGDGSAAHLGGRSVESGDAYLCLGTSTWIEATTDKLYFDPQNRMQTEVHVVRDAYVYQGTMQTGGMAHAWCVEKLMNQAYSYADVDRLVAETEPGAGGALFMPYLMGERSPWFDTKVNGAFLGLRLQTEPAQMMRAVMEGVGFNLKILLDVIRQHVDVREIVLIGGGARSRVWKQILSDILNARILIPYNVEAGTSLGAAMIAGVGSGLYKDYGVVKELLPIREEIEPRTEYLDLYEAEAAVFTKAYYALKEVNADLFDIMSGRTTG